MPERNSTFAWTNMVASDAVSRAYSINRLLSALILTDLI